MKRSDPWGVYAVLNGVVVTSYFSRDYGYSIIIEYEDGYMTIQAHHKVNLVETGQKVFQGQKIAIMGDTGRGIPKPNKHGHLGLIPPGKPLTGLIENCINPVPWLITNKADYPYNTKATYSFQHDYGSYLHEGIDFSGLVKNLIPGWENGLKANEQRYYYYE